MKQKTLILGAICIFLFVGCFFGCGQEEKAEQPPPERPEPSSSDDDEEIPF